MVSTPTSANYAAPRRPTKLEYGMTTFIPAPSDPTTKSRRQMMRRAFRLKKGSTSQRRKFRARCPWGWSTWHEYREDILATFFRAAHLSWKEGVLHHVDHVIPLNGRLVSGLHVPGNLRIILAESNIDKGNDFDPDTWMEPLPHGPHWN